MKIPPKDSKIQNININPWMIGLAVAGVSIAVVVTLVLIIGALKTTTPDSPLLPETPADTWQMIQEAGVLRVATSADYPPFSYYNSENRIDGFDPALIREIGTILGVEVEITDYAFTGLLSTLRIGQADLAIAAISKNAEREVLVDFTDVYYIGEDGILARIDSGFEQITKPAQMAGKRIGVQRNSVYQDWAQINLVDSGIVSQEELFVYSKPEHAISDLRFERLDLVIMDLQPATTALAGGDLILVGKGLNQQQYVIALPKGANTLQAVINRALIILQNDGKVNQLARTYLDLKPEDVLPPPTPEPTLLPTLEATLAATLVPTPAACLNAMEIVKHLNYDDKDLTTFPTMNPQAEFQKGVRIKNIGSCVWTKDYYLNYIHGNTSDSRMKGALTALKTVVSPGQTYDLYLDLVAPKNTGKYVGYWQMFNENDLAFGQTIAVAIKVVSSTPGAPTATATSGPTATPTQEPTQTQTPPVPTPTTAPSSDLLDLPWVLIGYLENQADEVLTLPIQDIPVNLFFNQDFTFNGSAGCNTFQGRYVTNGIQIVLTDFVVTDSTCETPDGLMDQEALFLSLLGDAEEYQINENDQLELIRRIPDENGELEDVIILLLEILAD